MTITIVAVVAATLGYLAGGFVAEVRCRRTIREHEDASNRSWERITAAWMEDAQP